MQKKSARLSLMAASLIGLSQVVFGQTGGAPSATVSQKEPAARRYAIPPGPLATVLNRFADESGLALVYPASLASGLTSPGVSGDFTPRVALEQLLTSTGLGFRFTNSTTVVIEKSSGAASRVLGPVRVEGENGQTTAGINGSTDPTATEGTHSYASSELSIASKTPQSIRETPQSVSVITQQRMQDQNLDDFTSAMNAATGVTLVTGTGTGSNLDTTFYSRGFAIRSLQIDGGAPIMIGGGADTTNDYSYRPQIDMAMYDHIEILRGADGLFNGYGDPSGSINLTRKRPLDHAQVTVEGEAGSWSNYREVMDATAPLGFDDKLRGRFVVSNQDQDYFYHTAQDKHTLIYGILEADLTPSTLVSVGFSDTRQVAVPWRSGLPRYDNGDDLGLPRSTCLCVPWSRANIDTKEFFVQAEQHFGDHWSLKANLSRIDQTQDWKTGYVSGAVNPVTDMGPKMNGAAQDNASKQTQADVTLSGAFELFGQQQQILLGGNYQDIDGGGYESFYSLFEPTYISPAGIAGRPPVNVFNFNPNNPAFAEPGAQPSNSYYPGYGQKQWGAYLTLRLTPFDRLHFITGSRYSHFEYYSHQQWLDSVTGAVSMDFAPYTYSTHNIAWPPTYSLVYDVAKTISAYASYTDIYEEQSIYLDSSGHPIKPVTGSNIEAGLKLEEFNGKLNASIAAYRIEQKNFAWQTSDTSEPTGDGVHYCCYAASSNQVNLSRGVDIEVTGRILPGWQLFTGYTYNLNEYEGSDAGSSYEGRPLVTLSPKHLLKLWTSYQFQAGEILHRLSIGGGVNAQSTSFTSGSACTDYNYGIDANGNQTATCKPGATLPYAFTQGSYAVFATRIAYQIDKHWIAAVNVNNVTDRRYYQTMGTSTSGNWYGDPRNFMLTVRGSF